MSYLAQYILIICGLIPTFEARQAESIYVADACFNAKQYHESSIFSSPINGTIDGIKLDHINGSFNCSANDMPSFWGCNKKSYQFTTMLMYVTDLSNLYGDLYYPQIYTQEVSIEPAYPDYDYSFCERGCYLEATGYYEISGYDAKNSTNIILVHPSYNVSTTDLFMLQHSEACCNEFVVNYDSNNTITHQYVAKDNSGTVCVSIYFLYNKVSVDDKSDGLTLKIIIVFAVCGSIILCFVACIIMTRCNRKNRGKDKILQMSLLKDQKNGEKTYVFTELNKKAEGQEKSRNVSDMLYDVIPEAMETKGGPNDDIKRKVSVGSVDSDGLYDDMTTDGHTTKGTATNTIGAMTPGINTEEDDM